MQHQVLPYIFEVEQLFNSLPSSDLIIVDLGSNEEYASAHIPGAVHLDSEQLRLNRPPAPGLVPDDETLLAVLASIGLDQDRHVVAYDHDNGSKAARLLWTLALIGHTSHSLLNGGFTAWADSGYGTQTRIHSLDEPPDTRRFQITIDSNVVADKAYVLASLDNSDIQILDARSSDEYNGLKSVSSRKGHIPGSINLDWLETIDQDNSRKFKDVKTLINLITQRGFDKEKEIIVHCQTHMRSSHSFVMLKSLGFKNVRGYAGSWAEWSSDPTLPVININETTASHRHS